MNGRILFGGALVGFLFCGFASGQDAEEEEPPLVPLPVEELGRTEPVDFATEVFPILKKNCIACHSVSEAKAKLVLETPEGVRAGSENGAVIKAGDSANSVLFLNSAHLEEPAMPPEKNKANAKNLTARELGLLKLWIDQGAKGEGAVRVEKALVWRPMPDGVRPVYSVDVSNDGRLVAAGLGNGIKVFDLESGGKVADLLDEKVAGGGAHSDLVGAVEFSGDGWLASGGFREVKLWEKVNSGANFEIDLGAEVELVASSGDGRFRAAATKNAEVVLWESGKSAEKKVMKVEGGVKALAVGNDGRVAVGTAGKRILVMGGEAAWEVGVAGEVAAVAFCGQGRLAGAIAGDALVRVWDTGDAAKAPQELAGHGKNVVMLGSGGGILASAAEGGEVKFWKIPEGDGALAAGAMATAGGEVTSVAVDGLGKYVAASVAGGAAKVFSAADGKEVAVPGVEASVRNAAKEAERVLNVARGLANTRKEQREAALKKRDEEVAKVEPAKAALLKAEEEKKVKEEAEKGPVAELEKAKVVLMEAEKGADAEILALQEMAKVAEEASKKAGEEKAAAIGEKEAVAKAGAVEVEKAKAALAAVQGMEGVDLKPLEEAVRAAEEASEKGVDAAEAKRLEKENLEKAAAGELAKGQQAAKAAEGSKANKIRPAQDALKKAEEVAKKVIEEGDAARTAERGARLSVESAVRIVAREEEALKVAEAKLVEADAGVTVTEAADVAAKKVLGEQAGGGVRAVGFGGEGRLVMVTEAGMARMWTPGGAGDVYDEVGGVDGMVRVAGAGGGVLLSKGDGKVFLLGTGRGWRLSKVLEVGGDRVTALDFSPDGKLVAVGTGEPSRGGTLAVWDRESGSKVWEVAEAHSDIVSALGYSPDGKYILTCAADRMAKVFEAADGKPVGTFEGHTGYVAGVAWKADGLQFATAGADHDVKIWDLELKEQKTTQKGHGKEVTGVVYLGTGDQVVSASGDGSVRIANQGLGGAGGFVQCVAADAGGRWIVAGGADGVVRVWDAGGKKMVWEWKAE